MANQVVRPQNRREFMNKLVDPYDPKYGNQNEVFSEPEKLGQPEQNRALETSVKKDNVREFKVGMQDFDNAILYYFRNVIKPFVIQNNTRLEVPIMYGTPENWKSVQEDGYFRDQHGKLMAPLIMVKRRSTTQNRGLGFKLDGNVAKNVQLFQKQFSKRNFYNNFAALNNRVPETEYVAAITPDYVTVEYECSVWTYFVEQMDSLIEAINFASRTYWGDPSQFQFHSSIESFDESINYEVGEDRAVKNTFTITLNGYIIPDSVNKSLAAINRVYGASQIVFGLETSESEKYVKSDKKRLNSFKPIGATLAQDGANVTVNQTIIDGISPELTSYILINSQVIGSYVDQSTVSFPKGWAVAPSPLAPNSASNFNFFINGVYLDPAHIISFTDYGTYSVLSIDTDALTYVIEPSDFVLGLGKFSS